MHAGRHHIKPFLGGAFRGDALAYFIVENFCAAAGQL